MPAKRVAFRPDRVRIRQRRATSTTAARKVTAAKKATLKAPQRRHVDEPAGIDITKRGVRLTIVAQDPSVKRKGSNVPVTTAIEIPNEPLRAGPRGQRFFVVDYNPATGD